MEQKIDLKHLVSAARHVMKVDRQVIWFDNVDALEYSQQDSIHDNVRSFQTNVSALASIVIALRDENIRHFNVHHERGAPPYGRRFVIEGPENDQEFSYPGYILPPPSSETLRVALRRRLDGTKRLQSRKLKALYSAKDAREVELGRILSDERRRRLSQEISEINDEIAHFAPAISPRLYDHLSELSARTAEIIIREKVSHLANNSLRDVFRIHRDFLWHLLLRGVDSDYRPVALDYKDWYLATLFLGWIRSTERPFKLTLEDIFEHYQRWSDVGALGARVIGCSLSYLIINTLWNIELKKTATAGRHSFATFGELIRKLGVLGYDEDEIRSQLGVQVERSIVGLRFPEEGFGRGDETQVYATYCGKCLTGSTFNSFGYIFKCLESAKLTALGASEEFRLHPLVVSKTEISRRRSETGVRHQHLETEEAISQLIPYLQGIAKMHVAELVRIREAGGLGGVGWLARYRDDFGIPNDPQFRRVDPAGQGRSNSNRKALQLEAMLSGLLSYVKSFPEARRSLAELLTEYSRALHDLDHMRELRGYKFI